MKKITKIIFSACVLSSLCGVGVYAEVVPRGAQFQNRAGPGRVTVGSAGGSSAAVDARIAQEHVGTAYPDWSRGEIRKEALAAYPDWSRGAVQNYVGTTYPDWSRGAVQNYVGTTYPDWSRGAVQNYVGTTYPDWSRGAVQNYVGTTYPDWSRGEIRKEALAAYPDWSRGEMTTQDSSWTLNTYAPEIQKWWDGQQTTGQ